MSSSLGPHGLQHTKLPCPLPSPRACSNSCPSSWWCHTTISISVTPFSSHLQPFAASVSFPKSLFFRIWWPKYWSFSFSIIPAMNIQDWFPLGLSSWISLQSKGVSRVFSNTTVQKHQFFGLSFLDTPILTWVDDYWKSHSFDYMDLCQQSNVSAF